MHGLQLLLHGHPAGELAAYDLATIEQIFRRIVANAKQARKQGSQLVGTTKRQESKSGFEYASANGIQMPCLRSASVGAVPSGCTESTRQIQCNQVIPLHITNVLVCCVVCESVEATKQTNQ